MRSRSLHTERKRSLPIVHRYTPTPRNSFSSCIYVHHTSTLYTHNTYAAAADSDTILIVHACGEKESLARFNKCMIYTLEQVPTAAYYIYMRIIRVPGIVLRRASFYDRALLLLLLLSAAAEEISLWREVIVNDCGTCYWKFQFFAW